MEDSWISFGAKREEMCGGCRLVTVAWVQAQIT
jgi:hypothetical protein